jgi:tetratricopeptide (TPR) repeat protein
MPGLCGFTTARAEEEKRPWWRSRAVRRGIVAAVGMAGLAIGAYLGYGQYQVFGLSRAVRTSFAARRYQEASEPLRYWLALRPLSGKAHYYKAWKALALNQPDEAIQAIEQAKKLAFNPDLVNCLSAIYSARAIPDGKAEPMLQAAFDQQLEPRDLIAIELARIQLSTFRIAQAAQAVERWRTLAPEDPRPYLWRNEIVSRSNVDRAILILNYRSALERDPNLDEARLGLARELSKARRFKEAAQAYRDYLARRPTDSTALIGLGRDAFQSGDLDGATRAFETALEATPRHPDALRELGLIELRLGQYQKAYERFEFLARSKPFDHEIRYLYAQALELLGHQDRARDESAHAAHLRKEHDRMLTLRYNLSRNPNDLNARFQFAKWLLEFGQEEEGLRWTKEILRAEPRHGPTHHALADYYQKRGENGLANYHQLMSSGP